MRSLRTLYRLTVLVVAANITVLSQGFNGPGFTIGTPGTASCSAISVSGVTSSGKLRFVRYNQVGHLHVGFLSFSLFPPGSPGPPNPSGSITLSAPPDERGCNLINVDLRFIDSASQSLDQATTGCGESDAIPAGDYRTSTYGGPTTNGPVTSLAVSPGTLTAAQINGTWLACVFLTDPNAAIGFVDSTNITFDATVTAAGVTLSGRVWVDETRGATNAIVSLVDASGVTRTFRTARNGVFTFDNVEPGRSYIVSVAPRRGVSYEPKTIAVSDNVADIEFRPTN